MPAYNFQEQFADAVERGIKRQTVRKVRKVQTKIGDSLYLYTGMRTPRTRLLRVDYCCSVQSIFITREGALWIDGCEQAHSTSASHFAIADGFSDYFAFISFFKDAYDLPFTGQVIRWYGL